MFKKRLKGLLAMVLAGSMALTALPLTASATISGDITIKGGDLDGETITSSDIGENAFTAGVLHDNTTYLTENNLWAFYTCWTENLYSGYFGVTIPGDELANKLYNYKTNGVTEYMQTKIKYTHDLAFTTMDISDGTLSIKSADMINKKADVFPYDISSVISQIEVDPLKEITSWTAWYNRNSGNFYNTYNYAGKCVKINDTPKPITEKISADIVGKVYFADDYLANEAFNYGKTIIQLNTDYRDFELPVLNAVCSPEKIDGVQNTITVKHGETTALDGSFYLCYEKDGLYWITDSSASTENGIWDLIENMKTVLGDRFDPDSLLLLRDTTIYVDGYDVQGYFTSRDLYRFARRIDTSNSTIEALYSLNDVCIWKIDGNTDLEAYSDNANLINTLGLALNKYPTTRSVYIEEPAIYVTGIDPATNTTIADSDYYATDIMASIDDIVALLKQNNPGKQYKTSDWQYWECSLTCGNVGYVANDFRKLTPAASAIELFNQLGAGKDMLTYFPEVVFAPAVEVTAPIAGEAPSTEYTIKDTVGCYTVKSVSWFCGDTQLTSTDKFARGKQYTVTVTLKPDTGLEFSADTPVTINNNAVTAITLNSDSTLTASYTFDIPAAPITSVNVTVTAPELGKTPNTTATPETGANYTASAVTWSPADAKFQADTQYTASVTLTANSGYEFTANTTFKINGENAEDFAFNDDGTITVFYTFEAIQLTEIPAAAITVTAPEFGKTPNTTATPETGANYTASAVTWSPADAKFKTDTAYTATVTLTANFGYKFAANTTAKINGKNAAVTANNDGTITVSYTFDELQLTEIAIAEVFVTAPEFGKTPDGTAYMHDGVKFTASAVTWSPEANKFEVNTEYTATVTLTPDLGYKFTANTTAKINGNTAAVTVNNDGTITVSYTFAKILYSDITSVSVKVTAPAANKAPNTKATVEDGANYTASAVTWSPNGTFTIGNRYTAKVTLTANENYKFSTETSAKINGKIAAAVLNEDGTLTVSYTFSKLSGSAPAPKPAKPTIEKIQARTEKSVGWNNIINEISSAAAGSTINIKLNDYPILPEEALTAAIDRKVKLVMEFIIGRTWTIDGTNASYGKSIDLSISGTNVNIPADAYKDISCTESKQLKLNARELNFTAQLTASIGESLAGQNAAIYLYNEETGKLTFRSITVVDKNGNITFDVECGGKYFIALGKDVKAPSSLCGDVNGDGVVNALDASAILKNVSNGTQTALSGDTNGDGVVNALDASTILKYVVGDIQSFTASDE